MKSVRGLFGRPLRPGTDGHKIGVRRLLSAALTCALLVLSLLACTAGPLPTEKQPVLTVAAASDLQGAFAEVGRHFEAETGARVVFQFGSSGTLARQIEQGAPVDLFASASEEYVRDLVAGEAAIPETQALYALGRIVLVTYRGSGLRLESPADLLNPAVRRIALANPEHAPYGHAAREALQRAGVWDQVSTKVVYGENVRQALQFVQTGNAEAGIVALAIADVPEVASTPIDDSLYSPLRQSLVVVKGARQEGLARAFAAFVTGERGGSILKRYGFALPNED